MFKKTILIGAALALILAVTITLSSSAVMAVDDLEALLEEDLEIPTQIEDLIAKFSELDYQTTVIENGTTTYEGINSYRYLGEEEIQGQSTDKISFEIDPAGQETNLMIFWIADGQFKQAEIQGEIVPGQMVGMMGDNLLDAVFAPFHSISEYDLDELARIGEVSSSQKLIGDKEVEVVTITVEDIPEAELESGTVQLANLENYLMVVAYDFISGVEDFEAEFEVLNFELR